MIASSLQLPVVMFSERTQGCLAFLCVAIIASAARAQTPAPNPAKDPEWISVTGTVVSTHPHSFRLDNGQGIVTVVVVPGWGWLREGRKLIEKHRVTVQGRVEKSTKKLRQLVAAAIFDQDLGTYYDLGRFGHRLRTKTQPQVSPRSELASRGALVDGVDGRARLSSAGAPRCARCLRSSAGS